MISAQEIMATLEENSECLKFENIETSSLQRISTSLIEKINSTIIHNERILDGKFGNYGFGEKDVPLTQINRKFIFKYISVNILL